MRCSMKRATPVRIRSECFSSLGLLLFFATIWFDSVRKLVRSRLESGLVRLMHPNFDSRLNLSHVGRTRALSKRMDCGDLVRFRLESGLVRLIYPSYLYGLAGRGRVRALAMNSLKPASES